MLKNIDRPVRIDRLPGRRILPPGAREGIVINLPEHRLYYYPKPRKGHRATVVTYPVSIGRMDWHSPLGQTWAAVIGSSPVVQSAGSFAAFSCGLTLSAMIPPLLRNAPYPAAGASNIHFDAA